MQVAAHPHLTASSPAAWWGGFWWHARGMGVGTVTGTHAATARMDIHEVARQLHSHLGPTLVAALAGTPIVSCRSAGPSPTARHRDLLLTPVVTRPSARPAVVPEPCLGLGSPLGVGQSCSGARHDTARASNSSSTTTSPTPGRRVTNTHIRALTKRAYGYHSPEAFIGMAMLTRGGLRPPLPGRDCPTETSGDPKRGDDQVDAQRNPPAGPASGFTAGRRCGATHRRLRRSIRRRGR